MRYYKIYYIYQKRTFGSLYFYKAAVNILNQRIFTFHKMLSIHLLFLLNNFVLYEQIFQQQ